MKVRLKLWCLLVAVTLAVTGCAGGRAYNLPPAERLLAPGPGVGGPGPGVLEPEPNPLVAATMTGMGGGMMGGGAVCGPEMAGNSIQLLFNRPDGMQVRWDVSGIGQFDSEPLVVPGRKNFPEGGIYRLKITNIGREGVELYPTVEIGPTTPRTAAYLAHNAIPIQFTEEDFDQVLSGNFVTKVIYLPDPEFQEMALAGVETLVSTRLDPGMDPIVEADRRGSIMVVLRVGNKDVEMPGANGDPVVAAGYQGQGASFEMGGMGGGMVMGGEPVPMGGMVPGYVSGVTTPSWGYPITGTPIGLPGPPHIPFGGPAGLQKHTIHNHTKMHLPGPTERIGIHVRQQPGYSYPKPANHIFIREQMIHPSLPYTQPHSNKSQVIPMGPNGMGGGYCPDCP